MVRAFRADVGAALELPRIDQLATTGALDPQILRDLQIGALLVRLLGTKLAPTLEEIPHRRHGAPFRGVSGSLENGRIARTRARTRRSPRSASRDRGSFWRSDRRLSALALVSEMRDERRGNRRGHPE